MAATTKSLLVCWNDEKANLEPGATQPEDLEASHVGVHDHLAGEVVKEFEISSGTRLGTRHPCSSVCQVSPTDFAVSCGKEVRLCNEEDGRVLSTLSGHTGDVESLALIRGKSILATGADKGELFLWDVKYHPGQKLGELKPPTGHTESICEEMINPESLSDLLLSSGGEDETVRVWDWAREECLNSIKAHSEAVCGLACNNERGVMMTGGWDKKVKMWDLKNYEKIDEIGPFGKNEHVTMPLYRETTHRLAVTLYTGAIRMYDVRKTATMLRKIDPKLGVPVWGCEIPDKDFFCLSMESNQDRANSCVCAVKDDGSVLWQATKKDYVPGGSAVFGSAPDPRVGISPDSPVDTLFRAVDDQIIPAVSLRGRDGVILRVPRTLCGREMHDEAVVDADLGNFSAKDLLPLLTGTELAEDPENNALILLPKLFEALHLPVHLFRLCQYVQKLSDPSRIACLASKCDDLVEKFTDWRVAESEHEVDGLDAVSEAVLRCLIGLDWTTPSVVSALDERQCLALVKCQYAKPPDRPFSTHAQFAGAINPSVAGKTMSEIFEDVCAELHESRRFSNVSLTTSDGGKEDVHLEILLTRSAFFHHMLSFGGAEVESMKTTKTILLEDFTSDELSAYVSWIYLHRYPKDAGFRILVRLLMHFHMHVENGAEREALQGCLDRIRTLDREVLILRLLENGHLIKNSLPDELQSRLMSAAARGLGLSEDGVEAYIRFADDLESRVDERDVHLQEKDAVIAQKDARIQDLGAENRQLTSRIKELEGSVRKKRPRSEGVEEEEEPDGSGVDGGEESSDSSSTKKRKKKRRKLN